MTTARVHGSADQQTTKRFYTVTEAAQLLRLSAPTLYREIRAGRFPAIRIRGRYVIPAKAVDAMEEAALSDVVDQTISVCRTTTGRRQ